MTIGWIPAWAGMTGECITLGMTKPPVVLYNERNIMSNARELYQLQEIELAIEANDQAQTRVKQKLADSNLVQQAKAKLAAAQKKLEDTGKQQKSVDFDIDDLTVKIKTINRKLYDGKTTNSKELSALQSEAEDFQKKRSKLEDRALELMEEAETSKQNIAGAARELAKAEAEWEAMQKTLTAELTQLQNGHADVLEKHEAAMGQIEPLAIDVYKEVKKRKDTAVAKVEQGTCRGCRIAVSNAELQHAKSGGIVKCSNCGRILYLP
jgi:predicted  nucleic acid-binding Zn-ribbon protein